MNKQEFGQLVMDSETTLYRVAKSILVSDADCADAVAEGVVKAFAGLGKLRNDKYAKTWLVRIVINECMQMYNRNNHFLSTDDEQTTDMMVDLQRSKQELQRDGDEYSNLYDALSQLREEDRATVELHYIEEFSVKEIADMTGVSVGTVKSRLSRSRVRLKEILVSQERKVI